MPAGAELFVPSASDMVVLGQGSEKACSFLYLCSNLTHLHEDMLLGEDS